MFAVLVPGDVRWLYLQSIKPELNQDVTQQIKDAGEELFQAALAKDPTLTREIFMFEAASERWFQDRIKSSILLLV